MKRLRQIALCCAALCLALPKAVADGSPGDIESRVKAAYLYKFASYVEWPVPAAAQANTPVTIGVVGADEIVAELNRVKAGRPVGNPPVDIRLLRPGDSLAAVHILFIGRQEKGRLKELLDGIQSQPVLTVTESAGALGAGSVINFVPVDNRIRFEISLAKAERSGLKISSRLLGVAQRIESREP